MSKSAKKKTPTIVSSGDEDDRDVIPPTIPESRTPQIGPEAAIHEEQRERDVDSLLPPNKEGWRKRNARLAGLLSAAAELVAQLRVAAPAEDAAAQGQRAGSSTIANGQAREMAELQPAQAAAILPTVSGAPKLAAILSTGQEMLPTKFDLLSASHLEVPSLQKRLPFVREFMAAGGDWTAFQRRFATACTLAGWSNEEAPRALPTTLDDDFLARFDAIPAADRAMLSQACAQMAAIFDPPSNVRQKFMLRTRGETEMPLPFTRWPGVAACAVFSEDKDKPEHQEPEQACASFVGSPHGRDGVGQ
ncbi:unnamed protein product [Lampetra fluviatilis]